MPGKKKRIEAIRTKDESGLKPCGTGEAQSKPITLFSEFAFVPGGYEPEPSLAT